MSQTFTCNVTTLIMHINTKTKQNTNLFFSRSQEGKGTKKHGLTCKKIKIYLINDEANPFAFYWDKIKFTSIPSKILMGMSVRYYGSLRILKSGFKLYF